MLLTLREGLPYLPNEGISIKPRPNLEVPMNPKRSGKLLEIPLGMCWSIETNFIQAQLSRYEAKPGEDMYRVFNPLPGHVSSKMAFKKARPM